MRARIAVEQIAHGEVFAFRERDRRIDETARNVRTRDLLDALVRQRRIDAQIVRRKPELTRETRDFAVSVEQGVELGLALARFTLGAADDRIQTRQQQKVIGIAAMAPHAFLHLGVKRLRSGQRGLRRKNCIGETGGERAPAFR